MAEFEDPPSTPTGPVATAVSSSTLPRSARRCRIPKLNRSTSSRSRDRADARPKSMTLSRDALPWHLAEGRYPDMAGSMASMPYSVDDDGSVKSFSSYVSYASFASQSQGTEASSSRPMSRCYYGKKYVLHCDRRIAKDEEYLTPTQRKDREIRQMKSALRKQAKVCEEKDVEIERLRTENQTLQETVEKLRVGKCLTTSRGSDTSDDKNSTSALSFGGSSSSNDSDPETALRNNNDDSGISHDVSLSPRNSSGLDDDRPIKVPTAEKSVSTDELLFEPLRTDIQELMPKTEESVRKQTEPPKMSLEFERFISTYKGELDQLKLQHKEQYQDLKERFNDRVDDLLQKLTEANMRYIELRPLFDRAQDKIQTIESQLGEVQRDIEGQEEHQNHMYLKMYRWRKTALKACICASVAGLAVKHFRPLVNIPSLQYYFSPSAALDNLKCLSNWVEFRVQA